MRQASLGIILSTLLIAMGCGGGGSSNKVKRLCSNLSITNTNPPVGAVGVPYSFCPGSTGGVTPVVWMDGGGMPPGFTLDPATGCISGTPSAPGSYTFSIEVCDTCPEGSRCASEMITIDIGCDPAPTITTTSLPDASAGNFYSECIVAVDGMAPLNWTIVAGSGSLPAGLTLDPGTGCISGTATTIGTYTFTVEVCDSCTTGPQCAQQAFTLDVTCADAYEPNDSLATAYDIRTREQTWLTSINGIATADNDDWYEITVTSGYNRMIIDVTFTHANGNIDVDLRDAAGNVLASETTTTDNEHLEFDVAPTGGTHYIRVFPVGGAMCNSYDMWWDDIQPPPPPPPPDDPYEENDDIFTAYDLASQKGVLLSTINGSGVANDDDFYRIVLDPNAVEIQIDCFFVDALGDVDLALWDPAGTRLDSSTSVTDNESIRYPVTNGGGTYFIRVYPLNASNLGNTYDLIWDELICPDDPYEPNNDFANATDLTVSQQTPLSSISGPGTARNDDYFEILALPGLNRVMVDLLFTHTLGDVNIQLLDPLGNIVAGSYSTTDDEFLDVTVSPGTYYVRVFPLSPAICAGNTYDLVWDGIAP